MGLAKAGKEVLLEPAEAHAYLAMKDAAKNVRAGAAGQSGEHRLDLARRSPVEHLRLMTGARQGSLWEDAGQVNEGPRNGGDRDPAPICRILGMKRPGTTSVDPINPTFGRGQNLRRGWRALEQSPEVPGGAATQERPTAARQDCGEISRLGARGLMSHSVDAAMDRDQGAPLETPPDVLTRHPLAQQAFPGHDTV